MSPLWFQELLLSKPLPANRVNPRKADNASTSPTIYVNFHKITRIGDAVFVNTGANENVFVPSCGPPVLSTAMLSFEPGELSTLARGNAPNLPRNLTTRPFNIADLPCPPQSVMVSLTTELPGEFMPSNASEGRELVQASTWRALWPSARLTSQGEGRQSSARTLCEPCIGI